MMKLLQRRSAVQVTETQSCERRDPFRDAAAAAEGAEVTHKVVVTAMAADRIDGRAQLAWACARYAGTQVGSRLEVDVPAALAQWFQRNVLVKLYLDACGMNITDDTVSITELPAA